jgi:aspartate racemase
MSTSEHIGLVGGLGTAAGIFYYEGLAAKLMPAPLHLSLIHADLPKMMAFLEAEDWTGMADYLVSLIDSLQSGGATVGAITAITPHVVFDRVAPRVGIPMISALDVLLAAISAANIRRLALFGTRATVKSRLFGRLPADCAIDLDADDAQDVYRIYADVARGNLNAGYREELTIIAEKALALGADAIVLAGTDLSALFRNDAPEFPFLDAAQVHIDAITAFLMR